MRNSKHGRITNRRLALVLPIALWATPSLLYGQSSLPPQPFHQTVDRQFAFIDASLTDRADALLIASALTATVVTPQTRVAEAPSANLPLHFGEQPQTRNNESLVIAAARLERLRPTIDPILQQSGVPVELAAVILVESGGRTTALSLRGARGLWQLMPDTARRYGLRVNDIQDDRLDIDKSTRAAARYLGDLHLQFGTWTLALAAYNTGEQNVQRAIIQGRSRDFRILSSLGLLPLETRTYVPAVLAIIQSFGYLPVAGVYRVFTEGNLADQSAINKTHHSRSTVPMKVEETPKVRMIGTNSNL